MWWICCASKMASIYNNFELGCNKKGNFKDSTVQFLTFSLVNVYQFATGEYLVSQEFTSNTFTTSEMSSWSISSVYNCIETGYVDFYGRSYVGILAPKQSE